MGKQQDQRASPSAPHRGVGGGFESTPDFKVDKTAFSAADLSAIPMGRTGLSQMVRGNSNGNGNELANAPAKGKRFIPAGRTGEIALRTDQLSIDSIPWPGNHNTRP